MLKNPKYVYGPTDRFISANLNFGEYILNKIWENKDNIAMIDGVTGEKLTYAEIGQEAMNLAISLTRLGVKKGDVIAISSENRREFWGTVIGSVCAGAIVTTINIAYTNDELKHVLAISKPKYVFCSPLAYKLQKKTYKSVGHLKQIFIFGNETPGRTILYNDLAIAGDEKINNASRYKIQRNVIFEEFQPVDIEGQNDIMFILYSSGTTGFPKGVILTHLNVLTLSTPSQPIPPLTSLIITPWFHAMGLSGTLSGFARGVTTVYLPKFEVDLYLKTVEKYEVQQLTVVPSVLVALCKSNLQCNTSSVLIISCGAAPLYGETAQAAKEKFPSMQALLQGYGMTEVTLAITLNTNPDKISSVGTVVSHTVVKVVDPETKEVYGPNKSGEICVKSVMLTKGYIGKDRKEDFDEEGFLRTGDIGYYDDEGYFYIVDRLKELIKYNAHQVAPAEIETVLLKNPAIKEAAVVGIPHPKSGEVPLAFVVLQPGEKLTAKEVQDFVAERLSNPKHLRGGVRFIDEIPKTPTGKLLRRELKKMAKSSKSKL